MANPSDPEYPQLSLATVDKSTELVKVDSEVDRLRTIEDRVLGKAISQVEDALCWTDIDEGEKGIPDEWDKECGGRVGAMRRQRAALGAQKNAREAPVGLKLAKEVFVGVVKARATEKAAPRQLNIQIGQIGQVNFQLQKYERIKVDK